MLIFLNSLPFRFATRCIYTTSYMQSKNEKQNLFNLSTLKTLIYLREKKDTTFSTDQRTHTKMHIFLNHQAYSQMQNAQCMYFFSLSLMLMLNKRKLLYNFESNFQVEINKLVHNQKDTL